MSGKIEWEGCEGEEGGVWESVREDGVGTE